ncbi:phosphotransferase family protein [Nonomuraea roseoviolacea]|uniref:Aminoglycoside phosphotransferase (APT) family kinase protein n=1 Tax=Nonomuraea roseoviolacea subsp. carminata TaxID=160689 RepID=A0ABT1KF85_9ACTN|nr:aminoglycoside phosphotransferase family protein [Nonomuraea roseoviolacea]MCP2352683.1 aminoglycoside phosphotransferase (APT) family kinase protein [Nonomuraea roseoviolacea subsp. carminata]
MDSRTKRRLSPAELDALARRALGTGVAAAAELTDGYANAVWRLTLDDGRAVVLKVAPPPELEQLSYERHLLRMEAAVCELAVSAGVPVAALVAAGFDDPVLGGDYLVLGALDGVSWNAVPASGGPLAAGGHDELRRELGRHLARFNAVTGEVFGYPHAGITGATWREAYLAMAGALLADTLRYPTPLPMPAERIAAVLAAAAPALDEVTTPHLVHFDVWQGNVFLDLTGPPRIQAIIDHERAFWGDPLAEFVTPTIFGELREDDPLLAGYREVTPLELTPRALVRLDLYRAYLYLILLVENGPRQYPEDEYRRIRDLATAALTEVLDRLAAAPRA